MLPALTGKATRGIHRQNCLREIHSRLSETVRNARAAKPAKRSQHRQGVIVSMDIEQLMNGAVKVHGTVSLLSSVVTIVVNSLSASGDGSIGCHRLCHGGSDGRPQKQIEIGKEQTTNHSVFIGKARRYRIKNTVVGTGSKAGIDKITRRQGFEKRNGACDVARIRGDVPSRHHGRNRLAGTFGTRFLRRRR